MPNRIKIDSSKVRAVQSKLRQAKKKLQVGWFEAAKYDDGTPVAGVAAMNEFGTKTAPPRPFMRPAAASNQGKWRDTYLQAAKQWIGGSWSYDQVLTAVGLTVEADIKNAIVDGNHEPLSPVTLALRRLKNENVPIGKKLVGQVSAAVAAGQTGSGELGQPFANKDPLRDTGYMISTITFEIMT